MIDRKNNPSILLTPPEPLGHKINEETFGPNSEKIRESLQSTIDELAVARKNYGFLVNLGSTTESEWKTRLTETKANIDRLEDQLLTRAKPLKEQGIITDYDLEKINVKIGREELEGRKNFLDFKEKQIANIQENAEKKHAEGGVPIKLLETALKVKDAGIHLAEGAAMITLGNLAQVLGFAKGALTLSNPIREAGEFGGATLEAIRQTTNKYSTTSSILGSNEEFANMKLPEAFLKVNPLSYISDVLVTPALELTDIGRVEIQRAGFNATALATGGRRASHNEYINHQRLSEDGFLYAADISTQLSKMAIGLAAMGPQSATALLRSASVMTGMGTGIGSSEILINKEEFNLPNFISRTLDATADSSLFAGTISGLSKAYLSTNATKIAAHGSKLNPAQVEALEELSLKVQFISASADILDAHGDISDSLLEFKKTDTSGSYFGAILGTLFASLGTADVRASNSLYSKDDLLSRNKFIVEESNITVEESITPDNQTSTPTRDSKSTTTSDLSQSNKLSEGNTNTPSDTKTNPDGTSLADTAGPTDTTVQKINNPSIEAITYPVTTFEIFRECLKLVHDLYVQSGLMPPHPSGMRVTKYLLFPETTVFAYVKDDKVQGTMTFIPQTEQSNVPAATQYATELQENIPQGKKFAEISLFATAKGNTAMHSEALFALMTSVYNYGSSLVNDLVSVVHPRHAGFYKRFINFKPISEAKEYQQVEGLPGQLLVHDYDETRSHLDEQSKILKLMISQGNSSNKTNERYHLTANDVRYLLYCVPELEASISPQEKTYLNSIYGNIFPKPE